MRRCLLEFHVSCLQDGRWEYLVWFEGGWTTNWQRHWGQFAPDNVSSFLVVSLSLSLEKKTPKKETLRGKSVSNKLVVARFSQFLPSF